MKEQDINTQIRNKIDELAKLVFKNNPHAIALTVIAHMDIKAKNIDARGITIKRPEEKKDAKEKA